VFYKLEKPVIPVTNDIKVVYRRNCSSHINRITPIIKVRYSYITVKRPTNGHN